MKFAIDTEFNGFGGEVLSMALVPWDEDAPTFYICVPRPHGALNPWVAQNVWPMIHQIGDGAISGGVVVANAEDWAGYIAEYLTNENHRFGVPYIIADWPDDIRYFCEAVITGPGEMASIPRLQFDVVRVDPYESGSAPPLAIRHNAWWDAVALRDHLKKHSA